MAHKITGGYRLFSIINHCLLLLLAVSCMLPLLHILALSFSSGSAVTAGKVTFWPVDWTIAAYENVFGKKEYLAAFWISIKRVLLGTTLNMLLTILIAYPLSKENSHFKGRTLYAWYFVFTMLFSGGLIPWYMVIRETGLMDTIWALVLPSAVPIFNVIVLLNFFRGLPKELEESAKMDGAGPFTVLWRIYVPLSLPALATILLFAVVGHWNSWFDGLILANRTENYPLQSFLHTIIIKLDPAYLTPKEAELAALMNDRTSRAAQIFVAAFPILIVYPFLQRFFMKGIVLGSVKE
ncbi:carbohydrate ABC transporter permease [Paenibacillus eucommiae]|uniref:Aldouronate transport system permease protein n=1 Tax=Paenibacillus eucommiae TaxID=1355755 RepID=A0ABS4ISC8_9BACL|nr:carbohydrate ABC transporter permease [Paenibacillus eucommiae]MBP1990471.1 putative aldouronate transport system permease protein [Paenibacillus eucommiae]